MIAAEKSEPLGPNVTFSSSMDRIRSCFTVGFVEDVIGGFGPDEGVGAVIPGGNEFLMAAMSSRTPAKVPGDDERAAKPA
jgi:hypothetical protein